MTQGDMIREWALRLRSVLEFNDAADITVNLRDGTEISYELGHGLVWVTPEGRRLVVPEEALDAERWETVA